MTTQSDPLAGLEERGMDEEYGAALGQQQASEAPLKRRILERVRTDFDWALLESHEMTATFLCPQSVLELPHEERVQCWAIKTNPIYWGITLSTTWCILSGKWLHDVFGQGGPVRPDETPVEHEARVIFIYATDGPIFISAFFTACWILGFILQDSQSDTQKKNSLTASIFDILVDLSYLLGNIFFIEAMRRQKGLLVRCAVVSNATFALGLTVLLVLGIFDSDMYAATSYAWQRAITWSLRFIVVLFLAAATYVYAQLWHLYKPNYSEENFACYQYTAIAASALIIWFLLFAIVSDGQAISLWDALT